MAAGGRVSYGPYRDVSKQLIARLRKFAGVGIVEKASIDEAYIQCMTKTQHADLEPMTAMQQAAQLAETIRHVGRHTALLTAVAHVRASWSASLSKSTHRHLWLGIGHQLSMISLSKSGYGIQTESCTVNCTLTWTLLEH